ncbi:hypothetical protein D3C86_1180470 [compost metagenome]
MQRLGEARLGQRARARHVGEGQALGGEAHVGQPGIGQRALVGAHAVVVRDAGIGLERPGAFAGRIAHIDHIGAMFGHERGNQGVEQRLAPRAARRAEHGRLLLGLAAAAEHGEAGMGARAGQPLGHLARGVVHQGRRGAGLAAIVEIGEHEVLPDHQAEGVALAVERFAGIAGHAADADHVGAGVARQLQPAGHGFVGVGQTRQVVAGNAGAPAEHALAVHAQRERAGLAVAVFGDGAEAGLAAGDGVAAHLGLHAVQRRLAVRMGPPALGIGHAQGAGQRVRAHAAQLALPDAAIGPFGPEAALHRRRAGKVELQRHHAVAAIEMARQHGARAMRDIRALGVQQLDVAPRAHRVHGRAPAGHVAEQRGAHRAQRGRLDHARLPAHRAALRAQPRMQRAEADMEHIVSALQLHCHLVRHEHMARGEHLHAVEPDLGQRGQPVAAEHAAATAGEMEPVPVVVLVQRRRGGIVPPAGGAQRAGHRTRHRRGQPVPVLAQFARMRGRAGQRLQEGPVALQPRIAHGHAGPQDGLQRRFRITRGHVTVSPK